MRNLALACAVGVVLSAAAASAQPAPRPSPIPEGSTYVAMGSSFAAGPGIAQMAADTVPRCSQSSDNYPRQLARARKLKLVDRSCIGATAVDILRGGQFGLPPQLDALTPDARLVTVTIGGNDVRFTADMGAGSCRVRAQAEPAPAAGTRPCPTAPVGFDLDQAFTTLEADLTAIAAEVRRRSPQARLVFVDYVTIVPPADTCAALSLTAADVAELRARADRLARLTAAVAARAGADVVKASALTAGHDACAAQPWARGYAVRANPGDWTPVGFHPLLPAATAIAQALDRLLGR